MHPKAQFHILSWITLLGFPALGYLLLWLFNGVSFNEFLALLEFDQLKDTINLIGLEMGLLYGFIVLVISQAPIFKELAVPQTKLLERLNLNLADALFISLCAGFGEEILFRVVLQTWFGPWTTSFLFIAVHGYFSLKVMKKNLLGLSLFPFIVLISVGYEVFGFWFAVAAHFSYDLIMFMAVIYGKDESS